MVTTHTISTRKSQTFQRTNARTMRHVPTDAEKKFWWQVRDRRLAGYKFKRQFLIGRYIVDFVCLDRGLVVELDGGQHAQQTAYDKEREAFLRTRGFRVIRFWNYDVLTNMDGIVESVLRELKKPPHPALSPYGGEGKGL